MPAFDMDKARVNTIKKLQKKLARYEKMEIEKMVEEKWDEATEKIASQLATALEENKKLKEQNKNVLKENKELKRCLDNEAGHHRMYEKKCKKLKEELLFYRFYEHTIGQGDTLTKEDVDNFTDSQVDRKILYDAIGYDEEEERIEDNENCYCDNCDEHCGVDDVIFIFERGQEDTTFCQSCGDDLHEKMRQEGWHRDDSESEEEE